MQLVTFKTTTGTGCGKVLCQFERWADGYFEVVGIWADTEAAGPQIEVGQYMSDSQIEDLRIQARAEYIKDCEAAKEHADMAHAE
jgi:hypothetical protein